MHASQLNDFSKLCVHSITTQPWSIEDAIENYAGQGIKGITVWRQDLEKRNPGQVRRIITEYDLDIVSLCRGGFFPALDQAQRAAAIDENYKAIDEASELGAPLLILVCGADPGQSLSQSRQQIHHGIEKILPRAENYELKIAIEPLHPMYADDRSAINTLKQANDLCFTIDSPYLGVAVDVYHLWWDPDLAAEIDRCGRMEKIFAFHISDWKTPTTHLLYDRGLMGEGCIPIKQIRAWVEQAGFKGFNEVEIFSNRYWEMDQTIFLNEIKNAYLKHA
jgi:sugar phosphate isomerase/epimerase